MNLNLDADKIWKSVKQIYDSKLLNTEPQKIFEDRMQLEHDYLYSNCPGLLSMCCSDSCDLKMIRFMLDNMIKIQKKELSEHDASVKVGEVLVEDFVKPQLEEQNKKKNKKKKK